MSSTVEAAQLGAMTRLDEGNFGVVYRLDTYRLPGFAHVAYKQFTTPLTSSEQTNLARLVDFRGGLDPAPRAVIDDAAAWPLVRVTERGTVCGFLMQLIPPQFFTRQLLPSQAMVSLPAKAQWLMVDPAKADSAGISVPRADDVPARLVLCAKLAHVLGVLHRKNFVYGDLSWNNVMFSAGSPPRVMVVDCDAVQGPHSPIIEQGNTPDWFPPEVTSRAQSAQDVETDRYKLALFILRCLAPGSFAQDVDPDRAIGVLDFDGNTMLRAGLHADRSARPTARQWYSYLTQYLAELTRPPTITTARADRTVAVIGTTIGVRWAARGAHTLTVETADGHLVSADAAACAGEIRVAITRSGPLTVHAENRYGTAVAETHPVIVLDPPRIQHVDIPQVPLPPLHVGLEPALTRGLHSLLATQIPGPSVALPDTPPFSELLTRAVPAPSCGPSGVAFAERLVRQAEMFGWGFGDPDAVIHAALTQSAAAVRAANPQATSPPSHP